MPTPTPPTPTQTYRIEECRRTIYVTSPTPPTARDVNSLLKGVTSMSEEEYHTSSPRRSKSLTGKEFVYENRSHPQGSEYPVRHGSRSSMLWFPSTLPNTLPNTHSHHRSHSSPVRHRILFYHRGDPYYGFTNFSPHPVLYQGKIYPTSEHLFQSFKFQGHRPNLAEHIRTCSEWPSVAFREARRFLPEVRPDWKQVNIEKMDETLWHKFDQHRNLREELLATGDAELVEDSDKDSFWGIGADHQGRNELGKALERLRAVLRDSERKVGFDYNLTAAHMPMF